MIPSLHNGIHHVEKPFSRASQVLGNNIANVNSLGYKSSGQIIRTIFICI